ncbi:MAG: DNA primase [Cytophagales bacterium]
MAISQDSIRKVKEVVDILDVIGDFVNLKKKGQNWFGLSPFQDEKTPSFSVSPGKGIFKDFSSGKAGDSITFIMEHERLSYLEAIRYLAKKYGIELEESEPSHEEKQKASEIESLHIALNFARDYFIDQLKNSESGKAIGLSYFKERGFSSQTIEKFELGYSQTNWDTFLKEAESKQFSREILEKAGLVIAKDGKVYDRYRGRVIFPIHNLIGKVIGFGARILGNDKNQPKYINSPETPVYNKSKELYGFYFAKNAIRNEDDCILVEGYTDVISLNQAGIENVIASSGTSLTEEQIKVIRRFTKNITLIFDGDEAGLKASERGLRLVLKAGMNLKVVTLPEGLDPDSFVKQKGGADFKDFLTRNKQDFLSFKTKVQLESIQGEPFKKAELIREIVEIIALIPDAITRSVYFKASSELLDIDEQVLVSEYNKKAFNQNRDKYKKGYSQQFSTESEQASIQDGGKQKIDIKRDPGSEINEMEVLKYLLNFSNIFIEPDNISLGKYLLNSISDVEFKNQNYNRLLQVYKQFEDKGAFPEVKDFLNNEEFEELRETVINIISEKYSVSDNWEKQNIFVPAADHDIVNKLYSDIHRLKWNKVRELKESARNELKKMSENGEAEENYMKVLKYFNELKKIEKHISGELGNVIS